MKNFRNGRNAVGLGFTLAEMMVVMLILSIVLAAFAPVMTRKSKVDMSSPWKWIEGGAGDIRYAVNSSSQMAIIGKSQRTAGSSGRLLINTNDNAKNHVIFEKSGSNTGVLRVEDSSIFLGKIANINDGQSVGDLGSNSVAIGDYVNTGTSSVVIGRSALFSGTTPANITNTIAIGMDALYSATNVQDSIAIGRGAMYKSTNTGSASNVAIGHEAMYNNQMGNTNTAIGHQAMYSGTDSNRTAVGYKALYNGGGSGSTAFGYQAMYKGGSGNSTAVGYEALYSATSGGNTALGYSALRDSTTGANNVAVGYSALSGNTLGDDNIAIGNSALKDNAYGERNIAIGTEALKSNKKTSNGTEPVGWAQAADNIAIGYSTLASNETPGGNIAIGTNVLTANTEGWFNTGVGNKALVNNTSGNRNTAIGNNALVNNTSGGSNTAVGDYVLESNDIGEYNTAIGYNACKYVKGSNKTCIGSNSGPESKSGTKYEPESTWISSSDNVERIFIGSRSKFNDGAAVLEVHNGETSDTFNSENIHSKSNVIINGNLLVKGSLFLPDSPYGSGGDNGSNILGFYGWDTDCDGAECEFNGAKSDTISKAIRDMYGANWGGGVKSDRRLKNISGENKVGLEEVKKLKVYNFTFKKDPKKHPHVGVIAQELQKIFPTAVKEGSDGYLTIRWDEMFYAVINAVKELAAKIDVYDKAFKQIQDDNKALKQEVKQLKEQNKKLEARLNALEAKLK